ncbi:hypothetical protein K505DRAFT_409746 [Melanomma pulvis-pyrius CBS 109.77]|uniref:Uncharacterized protein n=1 Tax=Melanomma pulvis-pyrius CBS 109.77 TaxID=1314802 RepID=A0A6A6X3Q0_9PLEO|nr:hypothetical protein K505DRAFT_409746 [Melanomma pulvis-pyrius CBS 109.77]
MARLSGPPGLSGLASEHHPEGPGDAPRRRRGRRSNPPSVDLTNNGKRPASPSETAAHTAHTKRAKRVQLDDSQQLARELDDAVSRSQADDPSTATTAREGGSHRRHSAPFVSFREDDEQFEVPLPPATQPLPGLTPHLDRVGAPRARSANISRRARMSLPAQLQIHPVDETDGVNEHQFAPLSAVLDGRMKRRLRRSHLSEEINDIEEHRKGDTKMRKALDNLRRELREKDQALRELNFQLEASRMGSIDMSDDQIEELEQKLEQANKEINELKASSVYTENSREMSAFDNAADIDDDDDFMLVEPADLNISEEQLEVEPHPNGFYAARALEMSSQITFQSLSSISQTNYDSLAEASQADPTAVPDKMSDQAVKRFDSEGALRVIAIELQNLHVVPPGASTIEKLFPNSTAGLTNAELLEKMLSEKVVITETHNRTEKLLRKEVDGLVDLLTTSLDRANEEKQRQIAANEKDTVIQEKDAEIRGLNEELEDKETAVKRLRDAIKTYRDDVNKLTDTVTRLEQQHADAIAQMEQDHAAAMEGRETAEGEALQKSEYIEDLEQHEETKKREETEDERDSHAKQITDLESQVEDFRANLDTERTQRVQTEASLDEASEKLEELNDEIRNAGIQANELQTIARLKDEAKDREDDLQGLLSAETQRRQGADEQVNNLEDMTRERNNLEVDRNEKVSQGNRQRDDLAQNTITTLQANITDLTNDLVANQEYTDTLGELATARNANEDLLAENKSLAKRVENEAHELLNIMGAHAEEANNLRQAIAAQEATIYTEELTEKTQEIEEMRIMGDNRAEDMKERFRIAEDDTRTTMDTLTEARRKLQEENEQLAAALLKQMKVKGVEVKTAGADLHRVFSGKITKGGGGSRKSKRQWDSGIGVDENMEAGEGLFDDALV